MNVITILSENDKKNLYLLSDNLFLVLSIMLSWFGIIIASLFYLSYKIVKIKSEV